MATEKVGTSLRARQARDGNPNWKGGRTIASTGYVLLRVGTDHHLSDVRGYAYEHRIVAERKIGRRLRPGEQVHHINGNRRDNRPENIAVKASRHHHAVEHRTRNDLRDPGESNPSIACACGCGESIRRYDLAGRPRQYISGHNPVDSPAQDAALDLLREGRPLHRSEIAAATNKSVNSVSSRLSVLRKKGLAEPVGNGYWISKEVYDG